MLVHQARDHVGDVESPHQFGPHRLDVVLYALQQRTQAELRVMKETDDQFHGTVAGAAAEAGEAGVQVVRPADQRLDRVGEGQLLVVVGVDAHLFVGGLQGIQELVHERFDLFAVQRPEAVHHVDGVHVGFGQHGKRLVHLAFGNRRSRHEVQRGLVALFVGVPDHVQRQGDLVYVGGDPNHVQHALIGRQDIGLVIGFLRVGHGRQLERRVVVAHDAADVLFGAELPRSVLIGGKDPARVDVADFHVVDPGGDAGLVDRPDGIGPETVVVHQAAVPYGAVYELDLRPVGQPLSCGRFVES